MSDNQVLIESMNSSWILVLGIVILLYFGVKRLMK